MSKFGKTIKLVSKKTGAVLNTREVIKARPADTPDLAERRVRDELLDFKGRWEEVFIDDQFEIR